MKIERKSLFETVIVHLLHCFISNHSCPVDGGIVLIAYDLLHYNTVLRALSVCSHSMGMLVYVCLGANRCVSAASDSALISTFSLE